MKEQIKDFLRKVSSNQVSHVVVSRQWKVHEKNYAIHDLEFAIVVFSLNILRHYFVVFMLIYSFITRAYYMCLPRKSSLRHRRLLELLKDYNIRILYQPSKTNVVVDALSRLPIGSIAHVEEGKRELD